LKGPPTVGPYKQVYMVPDIDEAINPNAIGGGFFIDQALDVLRIFLLQQRPSSDSFRRSHNQMDSAFCGEGTWDSSIGMFEEGPAKGIR
jgi:hypothetical protein